MTSRTHSTLRPTFAAACLGLALAARAQVPPPPVSPAPVVHLEYDAKGNFTKSILAKDQPGFGFATDHAYDGLSRRFKTKDARNKDTWFGYNGREDLASVTDPRGLITNYELNGLGDLKGLGSPDTGNALMKPDDAGRPKTRTDSRGVLTTFEHDALGRLHSLTYSQSGQASQVVIWNHDQTGAGFSYGLGRLTSTQFPSGSATYGYDPLGRLLTTTQTVTADTTVSLTTGYGYDAAGNITRITYPSGRVLHIPHSGGLPVGMSLAPSAEGAPVPLVGNLSFEPAPGGAAVPRAWEWQLNSGTIAHTRVFDLYGRLVRYPLGGALRDLTYDPADRIVHYTHWDTATGASVAALNQDFGYDELGRLTQITTSVGSWTIGYDDNGNRSAVTASSNSGAPTTRTYTTDPASNRLLALDNPGRTLTPDAAGNVVSDRQGLTYLNFTIDLMGRIAAIEGTRDGARYLTTAYAHDAAGQRVLKKALAERLCINRSDRGSCMTVPVPAGTGVVYAYDQAGRLLGEYRLQDGAVLREYVWLQDMPVAVIDGTAGSPQIYYVQTDHLGTPRTVIDRAGVQRWSWMAEPFGNSAPVEDPVGFGAFRLNLRMPGQYFDAESGLAYNWHRSYDAGVGRYTQSDPIGLQGGINTYAYVENQPTKYSDPTGLYIPGVHNSLAYTQAQGTCLEKRATDLGNMTGGVDREPGSQLPENSHQHAMCAAGADKRGCRIRFEQYVFAEMSRCDLKGLAHALHAVQDSFAPGHVGFHSWKGMPGQPDGESWLAATWHGVRDLFPFTSEPAKMTKALINEWCSRCGDCK